MTDYLLAGLRVSSEVENWQSLLEKAHDEGQRLQCSCMAPHPEMCVARINGAYHLRRMPNTGQDHSPDCVSFEPPAELSGYGPLAGRAVVTSDTGMKELKLAFTLTAPRVREPSQAEGSSRTPPVTAKAPAPRMSLLALLHLIWTEAMLTRWHPKFADKRTWFIVRRECLAAMEHLKTRKVDLHQILFIPPPWAHERKDQIAAERARFMSQFQPAPGKPQPIGLLLAEVKGVEHRTSADRIVFKHLPDYPFLMQRGLTTKFERVSQQDMELAAMIDGAHRMALATFTVSMAGVPEVREIATMAVTRHWLPFSTLREAELIEALSNRAWLKTLRFDLPADAPIATGLLTDRTPPVALFCPPLGASEAQVAEMEQMAQDSRYEAWFWKPTDAMPAFPAAGRT